jgi:hypothetical protein
MYYVLIQKKLELAIRKVMESKSEDPATDLRNASAKISKSWANKLISLLEIQLLKDGYITDLQFKKLLGMRKKQKEIKQ